MADNMEDLSVSIIYKKRIHRHKLNCERVLIKILSASMATDAFRIITVLTKRGCVGGNNR